MSTLGYSILKHRTPRLFNSNGPIMTSISKLTKIINNNDDLFNGGASTTCTQYLNIIKK
ncbi:2614_t:CDS:2 [Ambispora leptoticha]|uniref:2614_t:CDS:1 n=1 Tax=Ambispora leptoticha TaxID=144679 RepID=A0A9N8ZPQ8_9GLOM|nr:2614_t:CDS:2 [Ambispora leptoticha]